MTCKFALCTTERPSCFYCITDVLWGVPFVHSGFVTIFLDSRDRIQTADCLLSRFDLCINRTDCTYHTYRLWRRSLRLKKARSTPEYNRKSSFLICRCLTDMTREISHNYIFLQHASYEPSIKRAQLETGGGGCWHNAGNCTQNRLNIITQTGVCIFVSLLFF